MRAARVKRRGGTLSAAALEAPHLAAPRERVSLVRLDVHAHHAAGRVGAQNAGWPSKWVGPTPFVHTNGSPHGPRSRQPAESWAVPDRAKEPRPDNDPRPRAERVLAPSATVLAAALIVSLGLHLNVYEGLGTLRAFFDAQVPPPRPVEVSFVALDPGEATVPDESQASAPVEAAAPTDPVPVTPEAPDHARTARPDRRPEPSRPLPPPPEPPPEVTVPTPPTEAEPAPPMPRPDEDRRSIVQQSDDPDVENPDARFLADQARVVEEETVANLRNTLRDDPDPTASAAESETPVEAEGNATEDESADLREVEGDERRRITPHEAEQDPAPLAEASTSRTASDQGAATGAAGAQTARAGTPTRGQEAGSQSRGGGQPPGREVMVTDQFGSFVVRVPEPSAPGVGPGSGGGSHVEGPGRGVRSDDLLAGRTGARGGGAEHAHGSRGGEQLGLSYSEFESVFGEEELRREREARLEERRSRARGRSREREWSAFRAAIENYTPEVRPGNQTALNAAASPFATFLSDMHRRIHREFADRYIASLGPDAPEGLNDPTLRTTLEISVNQDGSLNRVGIVATSGNTLFDFGAFASVFRAQPFPRPPSVILSGDGRAWLRWHFDRGPRHCGTWNAEPYILANAGGPVDSGEPPLPDERPSSGPGIEIGPALPGREGSSG